MSIAKINKGSFENFLLETQARVEEVSNKVGKTIHKTIIKHNGVIVAMRLITPRGTKYYSH